MRSCSGFADAASRCGPLGAAIRTVKKEGGRRIGTVPRPVIAGIHPEPAGPGAAAARIEHRDRRVVGKQCLRGEDVLGEAGLQRLQPPDGAADPVGEGRAIELDALPREDLALPVERKMVAVFRDKYMSKQGGGREALGDRPLWRGSLMDGAASPAANPPSGPRPSTSSRATATSSVSGGTSCPGAATTITGSTTSRRMRTTR